MSTKSTMAEVAAAALLNDQASIATPDGEELDELCIRLGASEECYRVSDCPVCGGLQLRRVGRQHQNETGIRYRWVFEDGSALVLQETGWDFEGSKPGLGRDDYEMCECDDPLPSL